MSLLISIFRYFFHYSFLSFFLYFVRSFVFYAVISWFISFFRSSLRYVIHLLFRSHMSLFFLSLFRSFVLYHILFIHTRDRQTLCFTIATFPVHIFEDYVFKNCSKNRFFAGTRHTEQNMLRKHKTYENHIQSPAKVLQTYTKTFSYWFTQGSPNPLY